ncbi:DUF6086 family protein [Plantactinospora sp. GCM10030261]|uniref:DUF6086 family protein n=1 Tax=Plantactinospora sp. GCM10030261 TaxID=3273420 RepID=UPI00361151E8
MSYSFAFDGKTIWDPALRTGTMFVGLVHGAAQVLGVPSGLNPRVDGSCAIDDLRTFTVFVEQLWDSYVSTRHPVSHEQIRGVLLVCLVLLDRMGAPITPSGEAQMAIIEQAAALGRSMGGNETSAGEARR